MKDSHVALAVATTAVVMILASAALAGEPTDKIKATTDKILDIVKDPDMKAPDRAFERRQRIRAAADERFDWEEMSRRALGRYWSKLTGPQKEEFVSVFSDLIERTYMDKVENYSGETIDYAGETSEKDYAVVKLTILGHKNVEIPVEYRVAKEEGQWLVYDVSVEGVSLVNNYRTQFADILARSSYEDLLKRIKEKVAENTAQAAAPAAANRTISH